MNSKTFCNKVPYIFQNKQSIMKILFYYHEANNDLFALIDSETCYSHIGQHSNVSKGYINESKKVTAHRQDVKELKKELISIGYKF